MALLIPDVVEFVGVTRTIRITSLTLDGDLVTDQTAGVSVVYSLVAEDGTELETGALAYVASSDGTWEADVNVPDRPGELVHVHVTASRGSSVGKWHGRVRVHAFV